MREIGPQDLQVVFLDGGKDDDLPKREVLKGEVVGTDPFTDTAVIRVFSSGKRLVPMHPLPLGESAALEVGLTLFSCFFPVERHIVSICFMFPL